MKLSKPSNITKQTGPPPLVLPLQSPIHNKAVDVDVGDVIMD